MNEKLHGLSKEDLISIITDKCEIILAKDKIIVEHERLIAYLKEQLNLKRYEQFGSKSEKIKPEDDIFDEAIEPDNIEEVEAVEQEISVFSYTRKPTSSNQKHGRKALPEILPREEIVYDIDVANKLCVVVSDYQI